MSHPRQLLENDPFAEFENDTAVTTDAGASIIDLPTARPPRLSARSQLEREIIGSVILNDMCYRGARQLRPDDFEDPDHQEIWRVIREFVEQGLPLEPDRIAANVFISSPIDLTQVMRSASGNVDGIERAASKLAESNRQAWLRSTLSRALGDLDEGERNWRDIAQSLEVQLQTNAETGSVREAASVRQSLLRRIKQHTNPAIPTGIGPIDAHLGGGVMPAMFVMVGALGKTGKTVFLTTISYNWDKAGIDHLFITLERSDEVIESLKIGRELGVSARRLTEHQASAMALAHMRSHTRYLHSTTLDIEQIRHEILFQKKRFGIRAALIDYWQLIQGRKKGESLQEFRGRTAQEIQRTAIDADMPILMTCQVGDSSGFRDWESAKTAANLFLQINRDRSSAETWFQVITTNVTEEADIGSVANPPVVLRDEGPHFAAV